MESTDCYQAGSIVKIIGYKGDMIASIRPGFESLLRNKGSVFIETDEELVPYFFELFEEESKGTYRIRFEDLDSNDLVAALIRSPLWFPKDSVPEDSLEENFLLAIEGYEVSDSKAGPLGFVNGIIDFPGHSVLSIRAGKKEVLLPLEGNYIRKVNRRTRQILIEAPEGLIESYLG